MITYNAEKQIFKLDTKNTSYVIGLLKNRLVLNLYYGKKLKEFSGGQRTLCLEVR